MPTILRRCLAFAVAALLIAGCSRQESASTTPPSPAPTASAEPTPTVPASPAPADTATGTDEPSPAVPDEAAGLLARLTLEEKIGQLLLGGVEGQQLDAGAKQMIAGDHVGGIILFKNNLAGGLASSAQLLNALKAANGKAPVPLFLSVDQEGGRVSRLPPEFATMPANRAVGAAGDPKLAERMGGLIARQLKLLGFNLDFAPVLDIDSNPDNPVIGDRSFGRTPDVVSDFGLAEMTGLSAGGVIPVLKHFPGHGDTSVDSHVDLPVVRKTEEQLAAFEWVPFVGAMSASADMVMVAHILYPKIDPDAPASFSKVIIQDQLRGTLGFDGVVITDDMTMGAVAQHYGIEEAAIRAIEAGADIVLVAHGYKTIHQVYQALLDSVRAGRLTEARIDESVTRILKLKLRYRLNDEAVPIPAAADLPNDEVARWKADLKRAAR